MKVGRVDLVVCILAVVMGGEVECLVCIGRIETRFLGSVSGKCSSAMGLENLRETLFNFSL